MCTQYSLLKYIKPPPPTKVKGKCTTAMYCTVHNAAQTHQNYQCGIQSCPPFQNNNILPCFLSPSFFYAQLTPGPIVVSSASSERKCS